MKIECSNCHKTYDIPDERVPLGRRVGFSCPACKQAIELDLSSNKADKDTSSASVSSVGSGKQSPTGEALKKKVLRSVDDLPPMPQVVHKARKVIADPNSSFKDLAIVFVTDQAIASRVLKMANSAYYGLAQHVSSIQQASVVLGHRTLAELVTLASTSEIMGKSLQGYGLEAGDMWQHSLAVAFGARLVAKKKNAAMSDDAFAAGLIHDSGKLVLDKYVLERKETFENFVGDGQHSFLVAEREILGFDHAEIAFEVCKRWNVPENVATGIQYHHSPSEVQDNELANILHVADGIAMMGGMGTGIDAMSYEMEEGTIESLGLEKQDINKLMDQISASVENTMQEFHGE